MDFQYTFKQAHQDRLEDAGVVRYRSSDGFDVRKAKREHHLTPVRWLRPVFTALINLVTR